MTTIRAALLGAAAASAFATAATAQIQTLPETSRAQGQANAINNSLATQSENRGVQQQNQFEVNSLRSQPSVQPVTPPPVSPVAPPIGR